VTWSTADALTYAHNLLAAPRDPDKAGTTRLAEAFVALHDETVRLRLREEERLVLQTFAWDAGASTTWPATCDVIEKWLRRNER
jgi:hypothetical protein